MGIAAMKPLGWHARGTELLLGDAPFRGIGVNHYDLLIKQFVTTGADASLWSDDLADIAARGIPFIRTSVGFYDPAHWEAHYRLNKSGFYAKMDATIAQCERLGVGLLLTLFWSPRGIGDWMYLRHGVQEAPQHLADPTSYSYAAQEEFVREFVGRYQDSPAIYAWSGFNEPSYASGAEFWSTWVPDGTTYSWLNWGLKANGQTYTAADKLSAAGYFRWQERIWTLIKQSDRHGRAVLSGNASGSSFVVNAKKANTLASDTVAQWNGVAETEFKSFFAHDNHYSDILTGHIYPKSTADGLHFAGEDKTGEQMVTLLKNWSDEAKKPFVLEEFGATCYGDLVDQISTTPAQERDNFNSLLATVQALGIPAAAVWNYGGKIPPGPAWQAWKLTAPARMYQLEAIQAANAAMRN